MIPTITQTMQHMTVRWIFAHGWRKGFEAGVNGKWSKKERAKGMDSLAHDGWAFMGQFDLESFLTQFFPRTPTGGADDESPG